MKGQAVKKGWVMTTLKSKKIIRQWKIQKKMDDELINIREYRQTVEDAKKDQAWMMTQMSSESGRYRQWSQIKEE